MPGIWPFLFLFGSGLTALAYQVVWMREFRLVFGASTAATAAVSALFMAGLGLGGWLLGGLADRSRKPLLLYGRLELAITLLAAVSPGLIEAARGWYLQTGGMMVLGHWGATGARLGLAAMVLILPTLLMGGTLPAAGRAVTAEADGSRRGLGALYGINTLGALAGVLATNFALLEMLGAKNTLYFAVMVNLAVSIGAMIVGSRQEQPPVPDAADSASPPPPEAAGGAEGPSIAPGLILLVAAIAGFSFFLMELVWYRVLAPVLGGSTYTFGLILAVALAGIGLGGAAYPLFVASQRPSARMLGATCLLEAVAMLAAYAAGDWIPAVAGQLRALTAFGFLGLVAMWMAVALFVVFPAAFISGVQFPLLIALLGRGGRGIGRQTGRAYASNTLGSIAGSLAGGFGLLPWLGANGCWLLAACLLAALGIFISLRCIAQLADRPAERRTVAVSLLCAGLLLALFLSASGPTAAWRNTPVGAGRAGIASSGFDIRYAQAGTRWVTEWEADGVESMVAILVDGGYAFFINGKSDGHVIMDRGTQIMSGLVGAALHPEPKRSLVIGLGTGCTAGWMSAVDSMELVDVVELEPAVLEMARRCASANHDVVGKAERGEGVRILFNDAREVLMTTPERYDVIFSEPSNPYRAGIASLFTREFYLAVRERLAPGGIFINWTQAYEIDNETFMIILATLRDVFPHVESWQSQRGDVLFVSSMEPIRPDAEALEARLARQPYSDAMRIAWRVEGLEGFLSHFLARGDFLDTLLAARRPAINTDDTMLVEYGFAKTVGRATDFSIDALVRAALKRRAVFPEWAAGSVEAVHLVRDRAIAGALYDGGIAPDPIFPPEMLPRMAALSEWQNNEFANVARHVRPLESWHRIEYLALAESLAETGAATALEHVDQFADWWPACAALVRARLAYRSGDLAASVANLEAAFGLLRASPWEVRMTVERGIAMARKIAADYPEYADRLRAALEEPFALRLAEESRKMALLQTARSAAPEIGERILARWFEPNPPLEPEVLVFRAECYEKTGNPLLEKARADLRTLIAVPGDAVESSLEEYERQGAAEGAGE